MPALYTRNETVAQGSGGAVLRRQAEARGQDAGERTTFEVRAEDDSYPIEVAAVEESGDVFCEIDGDEFNSRDCEESDTMPRTSSHWAWTGFPPMVGESGIKALIHATPMVLRLPLDCLLSSPS